jgi:hypothetical protein
MAEINMRWLRNISVFEPLSQDQYNCDVYWWRNVFYINSLFPMKDMVRMRLKLFSPEILKRNKGFLKVLISRTRTSQASWRLQRVYNASQVLSTSPRDG